MLVSFPLPDGVFPPYDHELCFGHQLIYVRIQSINQSLKNMHTHTEIHHKYPNIFYISFSIFSMIVQALHYARRATCDRLLSFRSDVAGYVRLFFFEIYRKCLQFARSRCGFQVRRFVKMLQLLLSFRFDAHPLSLSLLPSSTRSPSFSVRDKQQKNLGGNEAVIIR